MCLKSLKPRSQFWCLEFLVLQLNIRTPTTWDIIPDGPRHRSPKWPLNFWKQHRLKTVQMRGGEAQLRAEARVKDCPVTFEDSIFSLLFLMVWVG